MEDITFYTLDEIKDKHIGKVGTAERDRYEAELKQYSPRVMHLRSLRGNGITPQDIENDERLAYLLSR